LRSNGTYTAITEIDENWANDGSGTWHTSGNTLVLTGGGYYGGARGTFTLSNDNNTLRFYHETLNRTSDVVIGSHNSFVENGEPRQGRSREKNVRTLKQNR